MSRRRVVVTGLGCVSPVGNTVEASWAALLAGKSGIAKITHFDASPFSTHFAGEVKDFNIEDYIPEKEARHMGRFIHMGMAKSKPHALGATSVPVLVVCRPLSKRILSM
jgi:3-oxoacyl-[acyl-carrier-protein] synthase II